MTVQFVCEGCGVAVVQYGAPRAPAHGFCAVCKWACDYVEPAEIVPLLRHLHRLPAATG